METTDMTLTGRQVRARLVEHGITQREFAQAAGLQQSDASAILSGKQYLGPIRQARIEQAIERLGLDRESEADDGAGPVFRIRQL